MKAKLHLLAIFYRSFGFYLWVIPAIAWLALGMPVGRDLGVVLPAMVLFKLFLQGITTYIIRSRYAHLFFFYANANLSQRKLFAFAFLIDFVLFFLSMGVVQTLHVWIK